LFRLRIAHTASFFFSAEEWGGTLRLNITNNNRTLRMTAIAQNRLSPNVSQHD
jgi:hypothetical protein